MDVPGAITSLKSSATVLQLVKHASSESGVSRSLLPSRLFSLAISVLEDNAQLSQRLSFQG